MVNKTEDINVMGIPVPDIKPVRRPYLTFKQGLHDVAWVNLVLVILFTFVYLTISYAGYIWILFKINSSKYPYDDVLITESNTVWYGVGFNWSGAYKSTNSLMVYNEKRYFLINNTHFVGSLTGSNLSGGSIK